MKGPVVIEKESRDRQVDSTGTARRYQKILGNQFPGYSLDEFIERSEQMTEVLKHFLVFPMTPPKKAR